MFKTIVFCFCSVFMLGTYNPVHAQTISLSVDKYVEQAMLERHIPGLSLAIIRDGVPVKIKGYGLSNIENNIPVHPETLFQSGSIGKQFTATAILQLKEEGRLKLDDKITKYFNGAPAAWQNVTIRNLLTHTSGIPDIPEDSTGINLQKDYTEEELLQKAMKLPLDFKPGERWAYSNTGYVLLGILIHKTTGKFYGDIIREKIFAPLSMETAGVINEADIVMNRSSGYELKAGEWKNQSWVSPTLNTTADGSLYLTTLDLIKWDAAITKEKILNHDDLELMVSPVRLAGDSLHPYGFAWFLNDVNGHRAFQHSGSWQGYNTYIARFPDDKLTVIVLTNLSPSNPGLIVRDVAAIYVPELGRPKVVSGKEKDSAITQFITELFTNPTSDATNSKLVSKDAVAKMKTIALSNSSLVKVFGPVSTVTPVENMGNSYQNKYLVKYKAGSWVVTVTKNQAGQIINVSFAAY